MATEFEKMVDFLDLSYPMKKEIVPCLIGPVGIGKTAAVSTFQSVACCITILLANFIVSKIDSDSAIF